MSDFERIVRDVAAVQTEMHEIYQSLTAAKKLSQEIGRLQSRVASLEKRLTVVMKDIRNATQTPTAVRLQGMELIIEADRRIRSGVPKEQVADDLMYDPRYNSTIERVVAFPPKLFKMIEEMRVAPSTAYVIAQKYGDEGTLAMLEEISAKIQRPVGKKGYAIRTGDVAKHLQEIGQPPLVRWRPTGRR